VSVDIAEKKWENCVMKKLLAIVVLGLFLIFPGNVNALDPKDSFICRVSGFLEFPDGIFCPDERVSHWNKLTKERFETKEWKGTYFYLNGDRFEGEFINGKRLKGYLVKKGQKMNKSYYIQYWGNKIYYAVPYALNKWGDCEYRPYSILTFRMKRINTTAYIGDTPFDKKKDFRLAKNENEMRWCFNKYDIIGPFVVKNEYKKYIIAFIAIGVLINVVLFYFYFFIRKKKKKKS
tara:strand:+ start:1657 stop:2358 length:702 start_codon:yes stop_codon:yes gene_type:complete